MKRKEFIRNTMALSAAFVSGMAITSCSLFMDSEMELCPESEIGEGFHKIFLFNRRKILVRRVEGKLELLSLICTHKRCTVDFQEEERIFVCPCHEGTYNFAGDVIDGPPAYPLVRFQYEIRDGVLWVLNKALKG